MLITFVRTRLPLSDYRFSNAERFAVWSAHDGDCFWCEEPIYFPETTIDHIFPESLSKDPKKLAEALSLYGLGAEFKINDFPNWVPAHGNCNQRKGFDVFRPSKAMIFALELASRKSTKARETASTVQNNRQKSRVLGRLGSALEAGTLTKAELTEFIAGIVLKPSSAARQHNLLISPDWEIVQTKDGIATVVRGTYRGITPVAADADSSWECPTCHNRGPWNGVMCMSCGQKSYPD